MSRLLCTLCFAFLLNTCLNAQNQNNYVELKGDSAVFSPDGKKILTTSTNDIVRIWDTETGKELQKWEFQDAEYGVTAVFSPDGKKVVTSGNGYRQIWDAKSGEELKLGETFNTFSPDGTKIVTGNHSGSGGDVLRIWDAESGKELFRLEVKFHEASFSPDSKKIITAGADHVARIWDTESGKELQKLTIDTSLFFPSGSFSPDGKKVVTDGGIAIRIWDAESGELLLYSAKPCRFLSFSPDGKTVVITRLIFSETSPGSRPLTNDGFARIVDADSGKELLKLESDFRGIVLFSPDGKKIVTFVNRLHRIWDAESGKKLELLGHFHSFSTDGKTIATIGDDNISRIWVAETGKELQNFPGTFACFSPDNKKIAIHDNGTIRIRDISALEDRQ